MKITKHGFIGLSALLLASCSSGEPTEPSGYTSRIMSKSRIHALAKQDPEGDSLGNSMTYGYVDEIDYKKKRFRIGSVWSDHLYCEIKPGYEDHLKSIRKNDFVVASGEITYVVFLGSAASIDNCLFAKSTRLEQYVNNYPSRDNPNSDLTRYDRARMYGASSLMYSPMGLDYLKRMNYKYRYMAGPGGGGFEPCGKKQSRKCPQFDKR